MKPYRSLKGALIDPLKEPLNSFKSLNFKAEVAFQMDLLVLFRDLLAAVGRSLSGAGPERDFNMGGFRV